MVSIFDMEAMVDGNQEFISKERSVFGNRSLGLLTTDQFTHLLSTIICNLLTSIQITIYQ